MVIFGGFGGWVGAGGTIGVLNKKSKGSFFLGLMISTGFNRSEISLYLINNAVHFEDFVDDF